MCVCMGWAFIIVFTVSSPQEESRMFLIWEKALSLLVRQVKFSGSVANIPTQLSNLASLHQLAAAIWRRQSFRWSTGRDWTGQEVTLLSTVRN